MAITHQAQHGELVTINPDDVRGPWTVELPATDINGIIVGIKGDTAGRTPITITAAGAGATIERADAMTVYQSTVTIRLAIGESVIYYYNAGRNRWQLYYTGVSIPRDQLSVLRGTPSDFAPGVVPTPVTGWEVAGANDPFPDPNPTTGVITLPFNSLYRVSVSIVAQQGNSNKELAIIYWLMSDLQGDSGIAVFDVATDKTDLRTGNFSNVFSGLANEELRVGVSWVGDASPGTLTMGNCGFTVERLQL